MSNREGRVGEIKLFKMSRINKKYLSLKRLANQVLVDLFTKNVTLVEGFKKIISHNTQYDGLFEIAHTYGYGDNGHGYYRLHLMLNLNNFDQGKMSEVLYLSVSYVPQPDNGHDWELAEVNERGDMGNFSPVYDFIKYMEKFSKEEACLAELHLLLKRKYPCPTKDTKERELATF